MNMQFYIKTEQLFPNDFLYGVITIVDKQPFDYMVGRMAGNREEIVETITKNVLKKNEPNLKTFNYYSFKYETLDDTKRMLSKFRKDAFYLNYSKENKTSLDALPAIFLSDNEKLMPLNNKMARYKLLIKNFQKTR